MKKINIFLCVIAALFMVTETCLATASSLEVESKRLVRTDASAIYGNLPLSFVRNDGQMDSKVKFYEKGADHSIFFTQDGVYLSLTKSSEAEAKYDILALDDKVKAEDSDISYELVKLGMVGANKAPRIIAEDLMQGKVNFFKGKDPKKWHTNVPTYGAVLYEDVYKGVDMKFYGNNGQLEYDVIVKPGVDPSIVKFSYEFINGLKVLDNGDMEVTLENGSLIQARPYVYQETDGKKVEVKGRFLVSSLARQAKGEFTYGFELASYDNTKPLVIDPVVSYSTYLGGFGWDRAHSVEVDTAGNIYISGTTTGGFPVLMSAMQEIYMGGSDAFITKMNSDGTALIYSTYYGGSGYENNYGLDIDTAGNAYITGRTHSADLPIVSPIDGIFSGLSDGYVAKINSAGSAIVYSTYLGGSSYDEGNSIAVDSADNAYVVGWTRSYNFPVLSAYQSSYGGDFGDGFVTKINAAGTAIIYSTFLGGGGSDGAYDIAIDDSGNAYVVGSADGGFPATSGAAQTYNRSCYSGGGYYSGCNDRIDAFVAKLDPSGSNLAYSTYLGGETHDVGSAIAIDSAGNAYVTGNTNSTDFPIVSPAIQGTLGESGLYRHFDAFITKISPDGSSFVYSTYLGGASEDNGANMQGDIEIDSAGNAYVVGYTSSSDFPVESPIQTTLNGAGDIFVSKIDASGSTLLFSTYMGGSANESYQWVDMVLDTNEDLIVVGNTYSSDFPTTAGAYQEIYSGGSTDVFVTKISMDVDSDGDGTFDDIDNCPDIINVDQNDVDGDGIGDACDDSDGDGFFDDVDNCPLDPAKTDLGQCGCGVADTDSDGDGIADCNDTCPLDPTKVAPGTCGCGVADIDSDGDGIADCIDTCPLDPLNDIDGDGLCANVDSCPTEDATGFDVDNNGCIDSASGIIATIDTLVTEGVIDASLRNSLFSKAENAEKSLNKDKVCIAIKQFAALISQVNDQRGNKISNEAADEVIAYANSAIAYFETQLPVGETCP